MTAQQVSISRSGRLIARANARLALPEAGKLPDAGAGGIDIRGDVDVDQIGLLGSNAFARTASARSAARSTRTPSTPAERAIAAKSGL